MEKKQYHITVLMPVYNGEKYLSEAIESVLSQTIKDFEFLIINDGSTDNTEMIVIKYAKGDKRIRYEKNEQNIGLVATLNKGLELSKGTYIARMDADDICHPERFQKQVAYLNTHPEIDICGTSYKSIGAKNSIHILPRHHEAIKAGLLFGSSLCHPSVFFRREFLVKNDFKYIKSRWPAEDYKAWCDCIKIGKLHNLKNVLIYYREHEQQISSENALWQKELTDKIRLEMLDWLNPAFNEEEKHFHINKFIPGIISDNEDIISFDLWSKKLVSSNYKMKNFSRAYLNKKLKNHIYVAILRWVHSNYFIGGIYNINYLLKYWRSGLMFRVSFKQNLKLVIKSILGKL